jgi:hypothetical protein
VLWCVKACGIYNNHLLQRVNLLHTCTNLSGLLEDDRTPHSTVHYSMHQVFSICCIFTGFRRVTASNAVGSSASVFTSLLAGDLSHNWVNSRFFLLKHLGTDRTGNIFPNNSSTAASRSCGTDRVENTASQLLYWWVLRICCSHYPTTAVVNRVIT